MSKKYVAEIVASEARGGDGEPDHSVGIISLTPAVVIYDNDTFRAIILGANPEGLSIAPYLTTDDCTYFRVTSARTDEHGDLQTFRQRIEQFANMPGYAGLQFLHDQHFASY